MLVIAACGYDWARYDPREGQGGAAGAPSSSSASQQGGAVGDGGSGGVGGDMAGGGGQGGVVLGPWTTPTLVTALSDPTADDDDPSLSADALEVYFNSNRGGASDIYVSIRASTTDPWGPPVRVDEVSSLSFDTGPTLSHDGLTLWVSSRRDGQAQPDVYVSTRSTRSAAWSTPALVAELANPTGDDDFGGATLDTLYALMGRNGNVLATSRATAADPWSALTSVTELNSSAFEGGPWLSSDGVVAVFNQGGDIVWATRLALGDPWSAPVPVSEVNSPGLETDPTLSGDQRYMMFKRGPQNVGDIYESSR